MPTTTPFLLDGRAYNVSVTSLVRKFSVLDRGSSGRTQDGVMYRDVIGTYYNYEMTVRRKGSDAAALDQLWEAVSRPDVSHVCTFPYGQQTLTQRMYVTSGEQAVRLLTPGKSYWNELKLSFVAMEPRVVP